MKKAELRKLDKQQLKKELLDVKKAQLNLRFRKSSGELTKTSEIRVNRRQIARIKTLLNVKND